MKVSSSKEKILKKIRKALTDQVPLPFAKSEGNESNFPPPVRELDILFAEEFTRLSGYFAYCLNSSDLMDQLNVLFKTRGWKNIYCVESGLKDFLKNAECALNKTALADCDASVTGCELLVARTGAVVMSSAQAGGRTVSAYAPVHICIAEVSQLVYDTRDALKYLKEKYGKNIPSFITFAAGPSRTADIEKTLVTGVHGPGEVYLFLIDKPTLQS
ncbi:MAG: LUD domain-containing protein [Bacteroidetes bacterium]|nr:LUD domain-containing protein [Bacteroidota bacterium]